MTRYQIENPVTGIVLGVYEAETEAQALDALARDAGYHDYAAAVEVTGDNDLIIIEVAQ